MIRNPTPKSELLQSEAAVAAHHKLLDNPALLSGLNTALLEMQRRLASNPPPDMGGAASAYLRILGASELVDIFLNLAESMPTFTKVDSQNLPGNRKA